MYHLKRIGKRTLAMFLALLTVFSLCELPAKAAGGDDVGVITLSVQPYIGGTDAKNLGTARSESFFINNYVDSAGEPIPEDCCYGFKVTAKSTNPGERVVVWVSNKSEVGAVPDSVELMAENTGTASLVMSVPKEMWADDSETYYFHAKIVGTDEETVSSVVMKKANKATAGIRYTRRGIQVRGFAVNDIYVSFGEYDYRVAQWLPKVKNDTLGPEYYSWYNNAGRGTFTTQADLWNTGTYENCYFPVEITDEVSESGKLISGND
ncbi:MAG: hypothetical protein E7474_03040 [Ruminococcaceae bacterium]|nr:hypothetical protein [Oscillospiraceae bacterium]